MVWTPFTRADHDRSGLRYASDTTDEEWHLIEPMMPPQPARGRRRRTDLRAVTNAIFYLLQSGCQWGLLPKDFPPKSTVHFYFKRFAHDGTWARLHDVLYRKTRDLEGRAPPMPLLTANRSRPGPKRAGIWDMMPARRLKAASAISWSIHWA